MCCTTFIKMRSLIFVLLNAIVVSPTQTEYQSTSENVIAHTGDSVVLSCNTNLTMSTENESVSWERSRDYHIITVGMITYTNDQRFVGEHKAGTNEWALRIRYVQPRDQGTYECQTVRDGAVVQAHLVNLTVSSIRSEIRGERRRLVAPGSTFQLYCLITGSQRTPEYIFWYHNERLLNDDRVRSSRVTTDRRPPFSGASNSRLTVADASPTDAGNYTCVASNASPDSVVVSVTEGRPPAAISGEEALPRPPASPWAILALLRLLLSFLLGQ